MNRPANRKLVSRQGSSPSTCAVLLAAFAATAVLAPADASASPPSSRWETHPAPTHEDLLLLPGSDILSFDSAGADGRTIYAAGTWNAPAGCIDNDYEDDNIAAGQSPALWKSDDGGASWRDLTGDVLDARNLPDCFGDGIAWNDMVFFSAVSVAPDDDDVLAVCGYNAQLLPIVVGSCDGGRTFHYAGCGGPDGEILCVDVSPLAEDGRSVAVGTIDLLNGGSVWRLQPGRDWSSTWEDTAAFPGWADAWLALSGTASRRDIYAVTSVAFSPSFPADRTLVAAVIAYAEQEDGDAYSGYYAALARWDDCPAWNEPADLGAYPVAIALDGDVIQTDPTIPTFFLRHITDLALPADYEAGQHDAGRFLLAVNGTRVDAADGDTVAEGGYVFSVDGDALSRDLLRHDGNPWVTSIDYHGGPGLDGQAIAGCLLPASLNGRWRFMPHIEGWFTDNGDHTDGDYVLPCCDGVAVLYSDRLDDCCPSWTRASAAPSGQFNCQVALVPDGSRAYATTEGDSRHGLDDYRWGDESAFSVALEPGPQAPWEQTGLIDTMIHEIVDLNYAPSTGCLYLHTQHLKAPGRICGCESLWRTCDGGARFSRIMHGLPDSSETDEDAFDDVMEKYHRGFTRPTTSGYLDRAGRRFIIGDAIDEDDEEQVEAGFEADAVYRLSDEGVWERISELAHNYEGLLLVEVEGGDVLYVGFDNLWWDFTTNAPLPYRDDGSDPDLPYGHECRKTSGVARCLLSDDDDCCRQLKWDYLIRGLRGTAGSDDPYEEFGFAGASLGAGSVRLWSIDAGNRYWSEVGEDSESYDYCAQEFMNDAWGRLWTYDDCLATASIAAGATDEAVPTDPCDCMNEEFVLEWERPCDACEYEIQVALDGDFANVVLTTDDFVTDEDADEGRPFYLPPEPAHPSLVIPAGMLDCGAQYWWQVRAHLAESGEVIASWWSEPASFRTAPGPAQPLTLSSPGDGSTRVPLRDIGFTWSSVAGATSYDFMLVDAERSHVASKLGPETSFVLPGPLQPGASYVWRVLALDGDRVIAESARSTFLTEPPAQSHPTYVQPQVVTPPLPGTPDWVPPFVAAVAVLLAAALAALSHVNRLERRRRRAAR